MKRGVQYLRELDVLEMAYYDPENAQLPIHPDEVQCTQPMWRKFVQSAPLSYANLLAVVDWKGEKAPTVDEVAVRLRQCEEILPSSLISALEKLSQKAQQPKSSMSYSPPVRTSISAITTKCLLRREDVEGTHYEALCGSTCMTTERTCGSGMEKPTSTLEERVQEQRLLCSP